MGITENTLTVAAEEKAAAEAKAAQAAAPANVSSPVESKVDQVAQQTAKAVEASLQTKIGNWLKDVYNSNKFLFYTVIPVVGLIYVVIKYHNMLIDLLIKGSKQEMSDAQKKDAALAQQAAASTAAGDALVKQAEELPKNQSPVDPNWDKK